MKIFIIDDDAMLRMVIADHLMEASRQFLDFDNGDTFLQAQQQRPDLILLDIDMPGIGGIEACRRWRAQEDAEHPAQIIFISGNDDMPTRLEAYDAGANDYIIKPIDADELRSKVKAAEAFMLHRKELAEQAKSAGQTAFAALATISEMSVIQQFMRQSFYLRYIPQLAELVAQSIRQYQLEALVSIQSPALLDGAIQKSSSGQPLSELEISLLSHAKQMDNFFQFSDRMVVKYPSITVLISKLPQEDPDKVGRLRDYLGILIEGASAKVEALEAEHDKEQQNKEMLEVLSSFVQTLEQLQDNQVTNRRRVQEINDGLTQKMIHAFVTLGLTDKQEAIVIDIAEEAQHALEAVHEEDSETTQKLLNHIADKLHDMLGQEETMTFF